MRVTYRRYSAWIPYERIIKLPGANTQEALTYTIALGAEQQERYADRIEGLHVERWSAYQSCQQQADTTYQIGSYDALALGHENAWALWLGAGLPARWSLRRREAAVQECTYQVGSYDPLRVSQQDGWALRLDQSHAAGWGLCCPRVTAHTLTYQLQAAIYLRKAEQTSWKIRLERGHTAIWALRPRLASAQQEQWRSRTTVKTVQATQWQDLARNPLRQAQALTYRLRASSSQAITPTVTLLKGGQQPFAVSSVSLSANEDNPYWQMTIQLAHASDFGRWAVDDAFIVQLGATPFAGLVTERELTRSMDAQGNLTQTAQLTGQSPCCQLTAPRALPLTQTWTDPIMARAACEALAGAALQWDILDWLIPANRLAADNANPLDVINQIVGAAGGLVESLPNGTLRARYRYIRSPREYPVPPDFTLTDRTIYSCQESPQIGTGVNQLRLVDVDVANQDQLEWTADADNPLRGTLSVYPSPWRDTLRVLTTRNNPPINSWAQDVGITQSVTETVEFTGGTATSQYPIMTLDAYTWLDTPLGAIASQPYTNALTATLPGALGYSLASIRYTVRYSTYGVECLETPTGDDTLEAQFLLVETT